MYTAQGKRVEVPKVVQGAVVVATKRLIIMTCWLSLISDDLFSAVLPEDRADILYHSYQGGGMDIVGPSVLVRKSIGNKVSVWGSYYADIISSASVDVVTQGSKYSEDHTQFSAGGNFLHEKTLFSLSITRSDEDDYQADSYALGISQDFFGDLTSLSLTYAEGDNIVRENVNDTDESKFVGNADSKQYGISLSQILTRNLTLSVTAETIIDEGYLNNPYRSVRYTTTGGFRGAVEERYPETHASDAVALHGAYFLPYRAALKANARVFTDSWGIDGNNVELRYVHPKGQWIFEGKLRYYQQSQADFFADMFTEAEINNNDFLASDKELDAFTNVNFGLAVTYQLKNTHVEWIDKATINVSWDNMTFDYDQYRDRTLSHGDSASQDYGEEDIFSFNANVIRLFFSAWY